MTYTTGNPSAMRIIAAALRKRAQTTVSRSARLDNAVRSTEFEGPAAARFRSSMVGYRRTALRLAGEMEDLAVEVSRAAARLENEQGSLGQI